MTRSNTNPEMFKQFAVILKSSMPPSYIPFILKLNRGGKNPEVPNGEKHFSWKAKSLTIEEAVEAMENGYNIGIAATDTDELVIIDIDEPKAFDDFDFSTTLMAKSGGRVGLHAFYWSNDSRTKINVPLEKEGEIRSSYEYVVAPGSWARIKGKADKFGHIIQTIEERMEEIPEADRDNAGKYELINEQQIKEITYDGLPTRFTYAYEQGKVEDEIKARADEARGDSGDNLEKSKSGLYKLTLSDVESFPTGQSRFSSQLHDSSTGANSSLISNGELHVCWRDLVTHNALQYAAVMAGMYTCGEAGKAMSGSGAGLSRVDLRDGKTIYELWEYLKNTHVLPENDPMPSRGVKYFAIKEGYCNESDIIDGWKLPGEAYIKVLKEHGFEIKPNIKNNIQTVKRLTDWGNAKRLVEKHGDDIKYCPEMMEWYVWNGEMWGNDKCGKMHQFAKGVAVDLWDAASRVDDLELKKIMSKFAISSENQAKIKNMIESAQNEPGIPVELKDFDKNKDIMVVGNGTVDLKTGLLTGYRKEDYITKQIQTNYVEGSRAPRFEKFLNQVMPDKEIQMFLQRFLGYCLTGQTSEQVFSIFYGHGSNGKGTLLDTVKEIIGPYAKTTDPSTIIQKKQERSSTNDLADLKGARLVLTSENEANQVIDEGRIKRITGQEDLKCRFLYKEFFDYTPEFKLILQTNHEPIIKAQDYSIWRRVIKVPFDVIIPKEDWDKQLRSKLLDESEGILSWLVDGAKLWYNDGLCIPVAVQEATKDYKEELDILGDFIDNYCEQGEELEISVRDFYTLYKHWCNLSDQRPRSSNSLSRELNERSFVTKKINGVRMKKGIDFKPDIKKDYDLVKNIEDEKTLSRAIGSVLYNLCRVPSEIVKNKSYHNSPDTDPNPPTDNDNKNNNRPQHRFEPEQVSRMLVLIKNEWYTSENTQSNNDKFTNKLLCDELVKRCLAAGHKLSYDEGLKYVVDVEIDQRTKINHIKDIILNIQSGNGNRAKRDDITEAAEELGITDTDRILKEMCSRGQIIQHTDNVFQVI